MRTCAAYADLFKRHSAGSPHYIVICNLLNVEGELAKGHDILTKNASLIFLLVRVCILYSTVIVRNFDTVFTFYIYILHFTTTFVYCKYRSENQALRVYKIFKKIIDIDAGRLF